MPLRNRPVADRHLLLVAELRDFDLGLAALTAKHLARVVALRLLGIEKQRLLAAPAPFFF